MKRLIAGITLLVLTAASVYAYMLARRERTFRQLVARGDAAMTGDNPFGAIEAFSGAIALKPDAMVGYLKRGQAYRRRGEFDAAVRDLSHAAALDPTATLPQEELGDVDLALRRFGPAVDRYRTYLRIDDRAPRVLYKLAYAAYNDGRPAAAIDPLQKALAQDDQLAEGFYLLGLCQRDLNRVDAARASLEHAIALQPALFHAREELADLYGAAGKPDKQLDQLEALAALDPSASRAVTLGLAYARVGELDRAVLTLGHAAERYADQPGPYIALGRVWLDIAAARHDRVALSKAMGALEGTLATDNSEALTLFGRALLLAHDPDSAERMLLDATKKRPVDPAAFRALADAADQVGNFTEARQALLDFRALQPEPDGHRRAEDDARIADLSVRAADLPAAVTYYLRAADDLGGDAAYLARAAELQWRDGDKDGARATLDRALEQDPHNEAALALKRRLRL